MAGLGRRTHYRKHLTESVWNDLPEPDSGKGERIAKVVGSRGGNIFEILVAAPIYKIKDDDDDEKIKDKLSEHSSEESHDQDKKISASDRTSQLAILPTKFHKLVWVKRNDFVIVQTGEEENENESALEETRGVRHIISHILYKDQVKHLKSKNLWPVDDSEFVTLHETADPIVDDDVRAKAIALAEKEKVEFRTVEDYTSDEDEDDGIVFNTTSYDDYYVNTNRIAAMTVQDSSEDESEEE